MRTVNAFALVAEQTPMHDNPVCVSYFTGKSWGGCSRRPRGSVDYWAMDTLNETDALLDRLAAHAWQEDPRPLSTRVFNDEDDELEGVDE